MKKNSGKILSLLAAAGIVASMIPQSVGAYDAFSPFSSDADDITVNSSYTGFTAQPAKAWYFNTTENKSASAGNMRVYKRTNGYGLTGGSSAIEFVANKQRQNDPTVELHDVQFTTDSDFYATMDIYVGDARDNDLLQIGGRYTNAGGSNTDAVFFLTGHGAIRKQYNVASTNTSSQFGGGYARNNWYRVTMAVENKDVTVYFDDQIVNYRISGGNKQARPGIAMAADMADMGSDVSIPFFGARVRNFTDTSDFGGKPQSFAIKNLAVHSGTYNPANTDTTVTSSAYTVRDTSVAFGGWDNSSGAHSDIKGIAADTTVSTFLGDITVPSGATKKVVSIDAVDKSTTEVTGSAIVTSDMKLLVTAADGAMKLYDLEAAFPSADTPTISSSLARYVVDNANKTITMPDTTVEKLTSVVTGTNGTTVAVKDSLGDTVASGTVRDTYKLVATKNGNSYEYSISLTGNTVAYDLGSRIGSLTDEQNLFDATIDASGTKTNTYIYPAADPASAKSLYGLHNGSSGYTHFTNAFAKAKGSSFTYNVKKSQIPGTDTSAYHFTNVVADGGGRNWYLHQSNALSLGTNTNNAAKGDKMVINFKVYIADGGFAFWPMHTTSGGGGYELQLNNSTNKQTSDRVIFASNKIQLGGERRDYSWGGSSGSYLADIGTYSVNQVYDVTVVESRGTTTYNGAEREAVITEGVYVNGTRLQNSGATCVILDGRSYNAIRDFAFATIGDVYFGGLTITMMDNYDPSEYVAPTPAAASLAITSNTVAIDSANKVITGWDGMTAAQLKAAVTASDANAVVSVMNVEGNGEIGDASAVMPNMLLAVKDKNYGNADYYLLSTVGDTGTLFTVADGNITATRTISVYNAEATQYNRSLIIAGYYDNNGNERFYDADFMKKNIRAADAYEYSVSIPYVQGCIYKAFWWNMTDDGNVPIEPATTYVP